jgi:hypothetical protein
MVVMGVVVICRPQAEDGLSCALLFLPDLGLGNSLVLVVCFVVRTLLKEDGCSKYVVGFDYLSIQLGVDNVHRTS